MVYLPPPAQAQAHPAQAHAQAQAHPPPPPPCDLPALVVVGFGGGFVTLVIPLVKSLKFPITPPAKLWTPVAIDAAKSEPGRLGSEGPDDRPVGTDVLTGALVAGPEMVLPKLGS